MTTLSDVILGYLRMRDKPVTARTLKRKIGRGLPLYEINKALYQLDTMGKVQHNTDTPPGWMLASTEEEEEEADYVTVVPSSASKVTHIFLDLDNIHDCLENAIPYANRHCSIWAFASPAYNHYTPPPNLGCVTFCKETMEEHGAAVVHFIAVMARLCLKRPIGTKMEFLVVSRNKTLMTAAAWMAKHNHQVTATVISTGWEELRLYLEG